MMRTCVLAAAITSLTIATGAAADSLRQFDLHCTGEWRLDGNMDRKSVEIYEGIGKEDLVSIDLDKNIYCVRPIDETGPFQGVCSKTEFKQVTPSEFVMEGISVRFPDTINRNDWTYTLTVDSENNGATHLYRVSHCEMRPFSGWSDLPHTHP
jgi:hypothetical protein